MQHAGKDSSYIGHLDAVRDGEVYGWAMDVAAPEKPVTISILINGQKVAESLAAYFRPDVSQALNCSGRHGFYVFLDRLTTRSGTAEVRVALPDRSQLKGSPLTYHFPGSQLNLNETAVLFMHIPKTAGTSLREAVVRNYRQSEVIYIYGDPPGFPITFMGDVPLDHRRRTRLVFGHYGYGLHRFIPKHCSYAAILRDPLHRIWSHYTHLTREGDPTVTCNGNARPIEEVLEQQISLHLDNLYVRYLCGLDQPQLPPGSVNRDVYELARKNASQDGLFFRSLGVLAEAYDSFAAEFNWDRRIECACLNEAPAKMRPTPLQEKAIRHFNAWDYQFYAEFVHRS